MESTTQFLSLVKNLLYVALSGSFIGGVRQKEEYSLGLDIGPRGILFFGHFLKLGKRYKEAIALMEGFLYADFWLS